MSELDLFETLKYAVGCPYISDLRHAPYDGAAKHVLRTLDLRAYSLKELSDAVTYLYGTSVVFHSHGQAQDFLRMWADELSCRTQG